MLCYNDYLKMKAHGALSVSFKTESENAKNSVTVFKEVRLLLKILIKISCPLTPSGLPYPLLTSSRLNSDSLKIFLYF